MQTYCEKHTDNNYQKKLVMMTNKEIKGKSRCTGSMIIKSFF